MKNQITTLENYNLPDLCKKGGLQDIYNLAVEAAGEVCDLSTPAGRKRQKSLAAKVSSSKVLFEKACISFLQDEELRTKEGRAEVKAFAKDMDKLRDSTKKQVLAIEEREKDEIEAYKDAEQMVLDTERAAQEAKHEEQAMLFAHMEGIVQNMEFDSPNMYAKDYARFHCENKGQVFDLEAWEAIKKEEEKGVVITETDFSGIFPFDSFENSTIEHVVENKPHFKMPEITIKDSPLLSSKDKDLSGFSNLEFTVIGESGAGSNFAQMAAVEDLLKAVPVLLGDTAVLVIKAIAANKIGNVEFLD